MNKIDTTTIKFLDDTIMIVNEALERLEKLRQRAEEELGVDYKNQMLIRRIAKEIRAVREGVIG